MKKAIEVCFRLVVRKMATIEKILLKEDNEWNQYNDIYLEALRFEESKRGISFISSEGNKRLNDDEFKGFCHNRFKSNFVVNGIDTKDLTVGQLLQIGESIVRITKVKKNCLPECPIIKDSNVSCDVNKEAFFGEVFKEGLVNQNDNIALL